MLNNFKFDYAKKYHYLIKYILMAIPLFLLILSYLFPIKQIDNNYQVETTTQVNYKYETNDVSTSSDIVIGNIYYYPVLNSIGTKNCSYVSFHYKESVLTFDDNVAFEVGGSLIIYYLPLNSYNSFNTDDVSNLVCVFSSFDYNTGVSLIRRCPLEYIPIENTTITNTINNSNAIIDVQETKVNNIAYLKPLNDFYKLGVNSWYDSLLTALNINVDNDTTYYIYHIPLYIIYFYIFDIILDIFAIIFRLGHKMINKFGGDY